MPNSGATVTTGNITSSAYDYEKIGIDDVFGGIGGRERVIAIQPEEQKLQKRTGAIASAAISTLRHKRMSA